VQYENEWFYQQRGVETGNIASVMVASITVFRELIHLFTKEEILFYKWFLDDILLLLDCTDISDVNEYISSLIKHRYLKFTSLFSLVKKPMSRHVYLHALADNPSHLKNLDNFQGIRVART